MEMSPIFLSSAKSPLAPKLLMHKNACSAANIRLLPIVSAIRYSKIAVTMPLRRRARRRAQRKTSYNDPANDNERLLPATELQGYPVGAVTDASPSMYNSSEFHTSSIEEEGQFDSHEILPRKPLRRVATPLKLRRCMDAIKRCAKKHLGGQLVIVRVWEERVQTQSFPKTSPGEWERKGHSRGESKLKSDSDKSLRSTIKWYFWSPSDTVKNCPTLEFVRTRLAPPNVWL